MAKMREHELLAIVHAAKDSAVNTQGEYIKANEDFYKRYLGDPYGDEMEGQSQVVSTDVADVVESDMPTLVRAILGSADIMTFEPVDANKVETAEAVQKTQYINWMVRHQKGAFKVIHDFLKATLIQKVGVVKYEYIEEEKKEEIEYDGLDDQELAMVLMDVKAEDIIERDRDEDGHYIKFKDESTVKRNDIRGVPSEAFIISPNSENKDEAELVGDYSLMTRGELIAQGYDEEIVRSLPTNEKEDKSALPAIRFRDEGGVVENSDIQHWPSEIIKVYDLYVLVDYDNDGVPERRRIVLAGNKILENEYFGHVPYAIASAILMPYTAIGRSRAEVSLSTQRIKTVLYRQMLDNIYRVNGGRVVVNEEVTNIDDLLVQRANGIVRTKSPDPRMAVSQLETPYIGDKALQVIQYVDSTQAASTGQMLANQGLDSDKLYNETATRFEGIEAAGAAKVELVIRVIAETGLRDLFEGLVWLTSRYNNDKKEILVTGQPMTITPKLWRHDSHLISNIGLAAGDNQEILQNMSALLTINAQLKASQSVLTDEKKNYNVLAKTVQAMGLHRVDHYFNDPEKPEQLLLAQNEQLMSAVEQMQAQQNNPLAEAEQVKAQAQLVKAQGDNQVKLIEANAKQSLEIEKLQQEMAKFVAQKEFDYTKLELENSVDIPGKGVNG
jgi:hypothetical protein